jgi:16S rRNA (cytidine1402-2'-O)-methyltransferase
LRQKKDKIAPGLYLIATPIGNLGDLTFRARETIGNLDLLLCEDTRVTRKLLAASGLSPRLESYHEHNAAKMETRILAALAEGKSIGLVSDAGTPLISDPGERLVIAATGAGHSVTALPGASAALTGLCLSGLPVARFFFAGFMPPKSGARRQELSGLATIPATLIFYESPNRLKEALQDMLTVFGNRRAAVARELTKLHENVHRGTLDSLLQEDIPEKGEIVILVAPPEPEQATDDESLDTLLRAEMKKTTLRDAVAIVSARTGRARREVYARAIALSRT